MTHALLTALLQAIVGFLTGDWRLGGFVALFYVGREHAQAEYRWIERYGQGKRANMPWWGGLDPKVWNLKSLTDWLLPAIVAGILVWIIHIHT